MRKRNSKNKNKNIAPEITEQDWQALKRTTDKHINRLSEQIDVKVSLRNVETPSLPEIASGARHIDELCELAFINEQKRLEKMYPRKEYYL
jgi:hypothetical protein